MVVTCIAIPCYNHVSIQQLPNASKCGMIIRGVPWWRPLTMPVQACLRHQLDNPAEGGFKHDPDVLQVPVPRALAHKVSLLLWLIDG